MKVDLDLVKIEVKLIKKEGLFRYLKYFVNFNCLFFTVVMSCLTHIFL